MWFILIAFFFYIAILISFASLFQQTGELCFTNKNIAATSFLDCFYFSCITFHTIGYGDIIPDGEHSKVLVVALSFLSLLFIVLFSGYSIHLFIKAENEAKKLKVKYIALQNLLKITNNFTCEFIPIELKSKKSIIVYYDIHSVYIEEVKEGISLHRIINEIDREINEYINYLKVSTENKIVHQLSSKRIDEYSKYIYHYLENLHTYNQKFTEYSDDTILAKVYDIIQHIDEFHHYYKLSNELRSSSFAKNERIAFPISQIVEKAIELQIELISMSKPIKDKNL